MFLHGKEMDTVMTITILKDVNLMVETAVELMLTNRFAANVNALKKMVEVTMQFS